MRSRWLLAAVLASVIYVLAVGSVAYAATITVPTGSFYFGDGSIEVENGDQLRFVIEDSGRGTAHTVEINSLNFHWKPGATGSSKTTGVIDLPPGRYYIYCKPHENKGHKGWFVVSGEVATTTTTAVTTTTTAPPSTTTTTSTLSTTTTTTTTTTAGGSSTTSTTLAGTTTTTVAGGSAGTTTIPPGDSGKAKGTTVVGTGETGTDSEIAPSIADSQDPELGEGSYVEAAGPESAEGEVITFGATEPASLPWLRSIWLAVILGIPLAALWTFAATRPKPAGFTSSENPAGPNDA